MSGAETSTVPKNLLLKLNLLDLTLPFGLTCTSLVSPGLLDGCSGLSTMDDVHPIFEPVLVR